MAIVLWIMIGGTVGFFVASLCNAAGRADKIIENMEINLIPNMLVESSKEITLDKPEK